MPAYIWNGIDVGSASLQESRHSQNSCNAAKYFINIKDIWTFIFNAVRTVKAEIFVLIKNNIHIYIYTS